MEKYELKPCPFCGGKVSEAIGVMGLRFFTCGNYKECGAIMSFDQKAANENPWKAKIMYNRRVDVKEAEE